MHNGDTAKRLTQGKQIARDAAAKALALFNARDELVIESKGAQDWVSNADKDVETFIRAALATHFPDDGVVGEEHAPKQGNSGYTWVIDPIDGTTSFLNAIASWCVVLACLYDGKVVAGIIVDPVAEETYSASTQQVTMVNGKPVKVSTAKDITSGSIAVGHSSRVSDKDCIRLMQQLLADGGMFYRNGSGALMLAYVAAGRLLGYAEPHMNAWDCLAGMFMIERAGGQVIGHDAAEYLESGGRVVAGAPGVYAYLAENCDKAYLD